MVRSLVVMLILFFGGSYLFAAEGDPVLVETLDGHIFIKMGKNIQRDD